MTMGGAAPAAADDGEHRSHARGHLIDADLLGLNLADAGTAEQHFLEPGSEPMLGTIDAALVEELVALNLGGISLPILGDGLEIGAVSSYAHTPSPYEATASAGAVAEDGSIDVSGSEEDPYGYATVDLTNALAQLGVDLDGVVDQLGLELGAVASTATANNGEIESDYAIAGARLALDSPLVDDITSLLTEEVGGLDARVNQILGEEGPVQGLLDDLSFAEVDVSLPGLRLLNVDLGSPELQVQVGLEELVDGLLAEALVSDSGITTIDLSEGEIYVDLEAVHGEGLNDLGPNTPLLSGEELSQITGEVSELLGELLNTVTAALEEALGETSATVTLDPDVSVLFGLVRGDIDISIDTTIAELLGGGEEVDEGAVSISGGLTILGIPLPIFDLLGALLEPILNQVVPAVTGPLVSQLGDLGTLVSDTLSGVLDPVLDGLNPVLNELNEVVTVTINSQSQPGNLGEGSFSVSALEVQVLPGSDLVSLPLATSTVYAESADDYSPAITLDPTEGESGDSIDVTGEDFVPGSTVTLSVTDQAGEPVGESAEFTVGEDGTFTQPWAIPEDTAPGDLTVDVTDNDNPNISAQETLVVNETYNPEVAVDPETAQETSSVNITGIDYVPNSSVDVTITDGDDTVSTLSGVPVAEDGTFDRNWTVPRGTGPGDLTVTATDTSNDDVTASTNLIIEAVYEPTLSVQPQWVEIGDTVTLQGDDFMPSSAVDIVVTDASGEEIETLSGVEVGEDGTFNTEWDVPEGTPLGTLTFTATDTEDPEITASDTTELQESVEYQPAVVVDPETALPTDTVEIGGSGFVPESTVSITITDEDDDLVVTLSEVGTAEDGSFSQEWTIPANTTAGELTIEVADEEDPEVANTAVLTIYDPSVAVDPTSLEAGEIVEISGTGYPSNSAVTVVIGNSDGEQVAASSGLGTDTDGAFVTTWRVPGDTAPGELTVAATADADDTLTASTPLTVEVSYNPMVTVDPEAAEVGEEVTIGGSDFVPSSPVTVEITDGGDNILDTLEDVEASEDGTFTTEWTISDQATPGELTVTATDGEGNAGSAPLTVLPTYTPTIGVAPEAGEVGDEIDITGAGFVPNSAIDLVITDANGSEIATVANVVADDDGDFTADWSIAEGTTPGELTVTATDAEGNADSTELTVLVTYNPTVTVEPSEANPGDEITIGGEGFVPESDLTIEITDAEDNPVGSIDDVTTDENGDFADESWTVPEDTTPGELTVTVTDADDNEASENLTVEEPIVYNPEVTVDPELVPAGQEIDIEGTGFVPESRVSIVIANADEVVIGTASNVVTDENGGFTDVSWTVPSGLPAGELTVTATDTEGNEAATGLMVEAVEYDPTVTLDPSETNPGEEVRIDGGGFVPETPVLIEITDGDGNAIDTVEDVTTDESGDFSEPWPVPEDIEPGELTVTVTDAEGNSDEATLTVTEPDDADATDATDDADVDATDADATDDADVDAADTDAADTDSVDSDAVDADAADADGVDADVDAADTDADVDAVDADAADADGVDADTDATDSDAVDTDADGVGADTTDATDASDTDVDAADTDAADTDSVDSDAVDADATDAADADAADADGTDADGTDADATDGDVDDPVYEANVFVNPAEVEAGNTVTVTGDDFAPNSFVDVVITNDDGAEIETIRGVEVDGDGEFTAEWDVPADASAGSYTVTATDTEDSEISGSENVVVTEADDTDTPDSDATDADATDDDGTDTDAADTDGVDADADSVDADTDAADAVDSDATDTDGVDSDVDTDATDTDAADAVDTDAADATDSDADGADGDSTDATDTDADSDDSDADTADTDATDTDATDADADNADATDADATDADANDAGDTDGEVADAVDTDDADANADTDGVDADGTDNGDLDEPQLSVHPKRAEVGQQVTFTGSGYAPNSAITLESNPSIEGVTSNDQGAFELDWIVTDELDLGDHTFTGTDEEGGSATTVLTVIETADTAAGDTDGGDSDSSVSVDPENANPGEDVTIEGEDFGPGETIIIEITDEDGNVIDSIDDVVTDEDGNFTVTWTVPEYVDPGVLTITVTDESGNSASAELTVTDPSGTGAGDAGSEDDGLASTGASIAMFATGIALLLIVIGAAILIARRNIRMNELS